MFGGGAGAAHDDDFVMVEGDDRAKIQDDGFIIIESDDYNDTEENMFRITSDGGDFQIVHDKSFDNIDDSNFDADIGLRDHKALRQPVTIILVRHAQSTANRKTRPKLDSSLVGGALDKAASAISKAFTEQDPSLTYEGLSQCLQSKSVLYRHPIVLNKNTVHLFFSSMLVRAQQTMLCVTDMYDQNILNAPRVVAGYLNETRNVLDQGTTDNIPFRDVVTQKEKRNQLFETDQLVYMEDILQEPRFCTYKEEFRKRAGNIPACLLRQVLPFLQKNYTTLIPPSSQASSVTIWLFCHGDLIKQFLKNNLDKFNTNIQTIADQKHIPNIACYQICKDTQFIDVLNILHNRSREQLTFQVVHEGHKNKFYTCNDEFSRNYVSPGQYVGGFGHLNLHGTRRIKYNDHYQKQDERDDEIIAREMQDGHLETFRVFLKCMFWLIVIFTCVTTLLLIILMTFITSQQLRVSMLILSCLILNIVLLALNVIVYKKSEGRFTFYDGRRHLRIIHIAQVIVTTILILTLLYMTTTDHSRFLLTQRLKVILFIVRTTLIFILCLHVSVLTGYALLDVHHHETDS